MNKRIVVKTVLICLGCFLMIVGIYFFIIGNKTEDFLNIKQVIKAKQNLQIGEKLVVEKIEYVSVPLEFITENMILKDEYTDKLYTISEIVKGEYVSKTSLSYQKAGVNDSNRIIVLPVDMEQRLANLIKPGSIVDLRLLPAIGDRPTSLLVKRLQVLNVLDEAGKPGGNVMDGRKAYLEFSLSREELERIYKAKKEGSIICELYVNPLQGILVK